MHKLDPNILRTHKGISYVGVTTAAICHDKDGHFLLMKRGQNARDEHGRWDILGGGLKHGVPIEDNIQRELHEELCTEALAITPVGYADIHRQLDDGTPTHWIGIYYCIYVDRENVRIGEPDVIDEIGWFTFNSLPSPLHSAFGEMHTRQERIEKTIAEHLQR